MLYGQWCVPTAKYTLHSLPLSSFSPFPLLLNTPLHLCTLIWIWTWMISSTSSSKWHLTWTCASVRKRTQATFALLSSSFLLTQWQSVWSKCSEFWGGSNFDDDAGVDTDVDDDCGGSGGGGGGSTVGEGGCCCDGQLTVSSLWVWPLLKLLQPNGRQLKQCCNWWVIGSKCSWKWHSKKAVSSSKRFIWR